MVSRRFSMPVRVSWMEAERRSRELPNCPSLGASILNLPTGNQRPPVQRSHPAAWAGCRCHPCSSVAPLTRPDPGVRGLPGVPAFAKRPPSERSGSPPRASMFFVPSRVPPPVSPDRQRTGHAERDRPTALREGGFPGVRLLIWWEWWWFDPVGPAPPPTAGCPDAEELVSALVHACGRERR